MFSLTPLPRLLYQRNYHKWNYLNIFWDVLCSHYSWWIINLESFDTSLLPMAMSSEKKFLSFFVLTSKFQEINQFSHLDCCFYILLLEKPFSHFRYSLRICLHCVCVFLMWKTIVGSKKKVRNLILSLNGLSDNEGRKKNEKIGIIGLQLL